MHKHELIVLMRLLAYSSIRADLVPVFSFGENDIYDQLWVHFRILCFVGQCIGTMQSVLTPEPQLLFCKSLATLIRPGQTNAERLSTRSKKRSNRYSASRFPCSMVEVSLITVA